MDYQKIPLNVSDQQSKLSDIFNLPGHLQRLPELPEGAIRVKALVFSARKYRFIPEGKQEEISGVSLFYSSLISDFREDFVGCEFYKVSLSISQFKTLSTMAYPFYCVFDFSPTGGKKMTMRLLNLYF